MLMIHPSEAFRLEAKDALFCHVESLSKKTLVSLLSTQSDSQNELTHRRNSSLLMPFPKDEAGLRMNGRRLSFQDTLKYRAELEVNVQQQGGLQKALSMQGSRTLEQTVSELMELFRK